MKKITLLFISILSSFFAIAQNDAIHKDYMNKAVSPGEDFYEYAIGNWRKNNPIPASESRWGSFNEVFENNKKILKQIMVDCSKGAFTKGTPKQKIGDFYKSGMDSVALNKAGFMPLNPYFAQIDAIKTKKELVALLGRFMTFGGNLAYGFYVDQDQKFSTVMVPYYSQGGLSLPDRDYYLKDDADKKKIRDAFFTHVSKMNQLMGLKEKAANNAAKTVLALETKLAEGSMDRVTQRDPYKTYNKFTQAAFSKMTPNIDWKAQAAFMKMPKVDSVIVRQPDFFKKLDQLIDSEPIADWKTYLKWRLVNDVADNLSDKISDEVFEFRGKTLSGAKVRKARWERVMLNVDGNLGELVGQIYVEKAFRPESKEYMVNLVKNMQGVFSERIEALDWMTPETKKAAQNKLSKFMVKIGYPDKWKDFSKMDIRNQAYVLNVLNANKWAMDDMVKKLGKPVDRNAWLMSPQTVNAYYNPSLNEIVFPAGILQPPFYDYTADDAVNYGAIGAVIGHEMTHGFDDEGRQYDAEGNLKEWWTKDDAAAFEKKANAIEAQFDGYKVLDSVKVNGKLTLGENLADLGQRVQPRRQ